MKVEFKNVGVSWSDIEIAKDDIKFEGRFKRLNENLVTLEGSLTGTLGVACDRCAEDFRLQVDNSLSLKITDSLMQDLEDLDIIECFDTHIDFDAIIAGEIEALRCDYHYCEKCS